MIRGLKYLFCAVVMIAFIGLGTVVNAENWKQFSKTHSPGMRIFYDTDSVKVNAAGDEVTFRLKSLNPQLGGWVQIADMVIKDKLMPIPSNPKHKATFHAATMMNKRTYDTSGNLIKEEGQESLGMIIGSDWDFLEDVLVFAGHNGLYPENKILMLNQYDIKSLSFPNNIKFDYVANRVKKVGTGIGLYLVEVEKRDPANTMMIYAVLYPDRLVMEKGYLFVGNYCFASELYGETLKNENMKVVYEGFNRIAKP